MRFGQIVNIRVGSFQGDVVYIADRAEFTYRYVQSVEGWKTTVYTIKIQVDNPNSELKPGLPVDVSFE